MKQSNIDANENIKARMSPAYDVYEAFSITDIEANVILKEWSFR